MAQYQIDTDAVAEAMAERIRDAAKIQLGEQRLAKSASFSSRRARVQGELIDINIEIRRLGALDRAKVELALSADLGVDSEELAVVLKEASIQALTNLGTHWMQFFGALGI